MLHSPSLQLSWAALAFMCAGAAAGMRHLHAHAVLHRDLKSGVARLPSLLVVLLPGLAVFLYNLLRRLLPHLTSALRRAGLHQQTTGGAPSVLCRLHDPASNKVATSI